MPGFKRGFKRTFTKKNVVKGAKFAYKHRNTAKRALDLALKLKDAVNIEYKEFNRSISGNMGLGTNEFGSISIFAHPLCEPEQGTSNSERIGDSIKLQRLSGRGTVTLATGQTSCMARLVVFRCQNPNNAVFPVGATTATEPNIQLFSNYGVLEPKLEATKYMTKFLYDKTFMLDSAKTHLIRFNINMPLNWHQNFIPGGEGITTGGLYLAIVTNSAETIGNEFFFRYQVSYTDD